MAEDRVLFVYGTLRDPDILAAVLGGAIEGARLAPAFAPGFRAVRYPGRNYPALARAPRAAALGLVIARLTPLEYAILDAYEGAEYGRGPLRVLAAGGLRDAEAFFAVPGVSVDAAPWDLGDWQGAFKADALAHEASAAAAIRAALAKPGSGRAANLDSRRVTPDKRATKRVPFAGGAICR